VKGSVLRRLERLEAAQPVRLRPCHRLIIRDGEDTSSRIAALIASGEAEEHDLFIVRTIVAPPQRIGQPVPRHTAA
jgi:hypothetical protein